MRCKLVRLGGDSAERSLTMDVTINVTKGITKATIMFSRTCRWKMSSYGMSSYIPHQLQLLSLMEQKGWHAVSSSSSTYCHVPHLFTKIVGRRLLTAVDVGTNVGSLFEPICYSWKIMLQKHEMSVIINAPFSRGWYILCKGQIMSEMSKWKLQSPEAFFNLKYTASWKYPTMQESCSATGWSN
jgi:hypothetical protein